MSLHMMEVGRGNLEIRLLISGGGILAKNVNLLMWYPYAFDIQTLKNDDVVSIWGLSLCRACR